MKKHCKSNWFINFLIEPKYRIYRHLLIWLYMAKFFILSDIDDPADCSLFWTVYFLSMFYVNMYLLVPKLLFRERYFAYIVSLISIIVLCYLITAAITESYMRGYGFVDQQQTSDMQKGLFETIHMQILIVFATTSIKLFQRWAKDNIRINELEKNSLQIELRELKNQINPHFLFNMLNNVNVLVRKDPDKASVVIHKLSDFLRYLLYDSNRNSVLLQPEIQFLNDFMELEKTRRDDFNFTLEIANESGNPDTISQLELPPNLFICFIENAIKHSVDLDNPSHVRVSITVYATELAFVCSNTKPHEPLESCESSGLGLTNIKRRLELLYNGNFTLKTEDRERSYQVNLTIPL